MQRFDAFAVLSNLPMDYNWRVLFSKGLNGLGGRLGGWVYKAHVLEWRVYVRVWAGIAR